MQEHYVQVRTSPAKVLLKWINCEGFIWLNTAPHTVLLVCGWHSPNLIERLQHFYNLHREKGKIKWKCYLLYLFIIAQKGKRVSFAMHRFTANFLIFRIFSCSKTYAQLLFYTFWCSYTDMHTEHFVVNHILAGNASKNFISKREFAPRVKATNARGKTRWIERWGGGERGSRSRAQQGKASHRCHQAKCIICIPIERLHL